MAAPRTQAELGPQAQAAGGPAQAEREVAAQDGVASDAPTRQPSGQGQVGRRRQVRRPRPPAGVATSRSGCRAVPPDWQRGVRHSGTDVDRHGWRESDPAGAIALDGVDGRREQGGLDPAAVQPEGEPVLVAAAQAEGQAAAEGEAQPAPRAPRPRAACGGRLGHGRPVADRSARSEAWPSPIGASSTGACRSRALPGGSSDCWRRPPPAAAPPPAPSPAAAAPRTTVPPGYFVIVAFLLCLCVPVSSLTT